jgi:hypothetical protein
MIHVATEGEEVPVFLNRKRFQPPLIAQFLHALPQQCVNRGSGVPRQSVTQADPLSKLAFEISIRHLVFAVGRLIPLPPLVPQGFQRLHVPLGL